MALPRKKTKIDLMHAHTKRTMPPKLEEYLEAEGYVLRVMSALSQFSVQAQAEYCYPLTKDDLEESAPKEAKELVQDILGANFTLMEDGTFQRGDVRLYVQTKEARDAVREVRKEEHDLRASEDHVYGQIDEMNQTLNKEARGLAKVEPGLFGGEAVPKLEHSASGGVNELNRSRTMHDALTRE